VADTPTVAITKSEISLLQALAGSAERRPCLIVYSGPEAGLPFDLEPGTFTIGRAPACELMLDSPGISRRHAELLVAERSVTVRDLGSVNGTFVNEKRIAEPVQLAGGDLLRFGVLVCRFYESQSLEAALHDRIYRMATVDAATEVFNRRYLFDALRREMRLARRHERELALVCVDLDHFKHVNDRWGHPAGDAVLRDSAAMMRSALQGAGTLGRLGGEEFAVVLPGAALETARAVAQRLCDAVAAHPFVVAGGATPTVHRQTLSAGVAALTPDMDEPTALLSAADRQLYAAKEGGRNRVAG
jgi:two-component system, cell cycle response regulator